MTGKRWPIVGHRLHEEFPYVEAEVRYAIREYACTAVDIIARRLRISFLNTYAAHEILDKIVPIMAKELNWSNAEIRVCFWFKNFDALNQGECGRGSTW